MKNLVVLFTIACSFLSINVNANSELHSLPSETTNLFQQFLEEIEGNTYSEFKTVNFEQSQTLSITSLVNISTNKTDYIRMIKITEGAEGAEISFETYKNCEFPQTGNIDSLIDRVISVDGQKIQSKYVCITNNESPSGTREIFSPATKAGRNFILDKMTTQSWILVKLSDSHHIPFDIKGFVKAWDESDTPAL